MIEANFDGLVGLSHNYGGLSYGNVASLNFAKEVSSPKQAALQGLKKAKALADRGLVQGILPPQMRPNLDALKNMGVSGEGGDLLKNAFEIDPTLLSIASSSSYMWTANAATVCPSADSIDGKVHLTPANLRAKPHRAIEHPYTYQTLKSVFSDESVFSVHPALELGDAFSDEGAANHTRFEVDGKGLHFFVYGREALNNVARKPVKFPARQTLEASSAIARLNQVQPDLCYFAQQNPDVIDAGVFHNDVISVGHGNVLLYHEHAFVNTEQVISELNDLLGGKLVAIRVLDSEVSVLDAVKTYLFNSQLVTLPEGHMALVAPKHCEEHPGVKKFIDKMLADDTNPVNEALFFDLLQSMKNGGGPACLRLRVQLTKDQVALVNQNCLINDKSYDHLVSWVERNYREELQLSELATEAFYSEALAALKELEEILNVPGLYS